MLGEHALKIWEEMDTGLYVKREWGRGGSVSCPSLTQDCKEWGVDREEAGENFGAPATPCEMKRIGKFWFRRST